MLRFLSVGSGVVAVCVTEAPAEAAGTATAGAAAFRVVVSGALSRDAVRVLSTPAAVCGLDAVETGGAPLLTDSGPQPYAAAMMTSEIARRTRFRVVEGSMVKDGSMRARRSETRAQSSRRRSGACKLIGSTPRDVAAPLARR